MPSASLNAEQDNQDQREKGTSKPCRRVTLAGHDRRKYDRSNKSSQERNTVTPSEDDGFVLFSDRSSNGSGEANSVASARTNASQH